MEIGIIKRGAIGDVVRTTSILHPLKKKFPDSKICWITDSSAIPMIEHHPLVDEIQPFGDQSKLRDLEFDLLISLDDEEEACKLASKITSKKLVGAYMDQERRSYTDSKWFDMGLISKYGKSKADELKAKNTKNFHEHMHEMLGLDSEICRPTIKIPAKDMNFAYDFAYEHDLHPDDIIVGINTGAGGRWPLKKWGEDQTIELIDMLIEDGLKVILFGGPEEKERNANIVRCSSEKLIDAGNNNSLLEFAALINLCSVLVTSDSLALHLGVATGKHIVALFGPTSSTEIHLFGRGIKIAPQMECLCCYLKKECGVAPNCMDSISVDSVYEATHKAVEDAKKDHCF
ncbi:glycosyltransferase family 9 protein [Candidatus Woesearchaeota archaeon]|nr:glycosyltransferase family 9 protein [Candidatus Woesearchaeota archaeon]